ncbi:hypothetical protein Ssi03_13270 [Sphaerisporangium siamense]|uniref:Uncharacterized protein n=1 Tax=Sphaerisporangium siamense TaxID=795645 RepID=A0A7W7DBF6_9ACTN|nr:hypothetical protein [Sphaerisporangium siamense]MBB4702905.1 hypothetical protein [Sphaerisporangium siamense]GII83337.1 hypothetical protein Ssi03_13270 [Sphaerisporangium siamense]
MSDTKTPTFRPIPELPEPSPGSVVLDSVGDAWQHRWDGWHCAIDGDEFSEFTWERLQSFCGPTTLIHEASDEETE